MGWHLLYACPRPHWGNEAVSVCCSGGLCVPFITVTAQRHTKREGLRRVWGGGLCCPICPALGFTTTGPTWRVPHPGPIHLHLCLLGTDSLCIGSLRLPRYVSVPLTGARVELLTRQWRGDPRQAMFNQRAAHSRPGLASSPLCLCGLRVNLLNAWAGAHPLLPTVPQIYCHTVTRAVLLWDLLFKHCVLCL